MLVQVLAALLLIQLPVNVPVKAAEQGPSPWAPAIPLEDPDEVPGFSLATVAIWGVNQ